MPDNLTRREFVLRSSAAAAMLAAWPGSRLFAGDEPIDDPLGELKVSWTGSLKWQRVIDVARAPGESIDEKLANAQAMLAMNGGGVVFFPAGTYRFRESIKLLDGVVLRGVAPQSVTSAHNDKYSLATKFEFPKFEPRW